MINKSLIITGGASGIAKDTIQYLSTKLKHIYIIDKKDIDLNISNTTFFKCDISKYDQVKKTINHIKNISKNDISFLFSCAGIIEFGTIEESSLELIDLVIDTNVKGTIYILKEVIPIMKENNFGKIVLMGSDQSFIGKRGMSIYGASKGAIAQITKSTALDFAKNNISVNCICPGTIETEKYFEILNKKAEILNKDKQLIHQISEKLQPLGRNGQPREISNLVEFLLSDKSDFITGSLISIDGGYTSQ